MYYCEPCDRYFNSENSYNQHVENSSAHHNFESSDDGYFSSSAEPEFECSGCDSWFWSGVAREEHHVHEHGDRYCQPCNRMFMNKNNLMQVRCYWIFGVSLSILEPGDVQSEIEN